MNSKQSIKADTLIYADWVIPVIPKNTVLSSAAVAIKDELIVGVYSAEDAAELVTAEHTLHLDNHVLIPGLVNSHGHIPMTLFRGIADDIPLKQWLEERIWPLEGQFVSAEFVKQGASLAIAEMIRSGTTCFADMYFFPEEVAKLATSVGIRTQLACPIMDFPTSWAQGPDEYIQKTTELHDDYRSSNYVHVAFGPHAPYSVSDEPLTRINVLAEKLDIPIHMHVHETAQEVVDSMANENRRPIQRLAELGLLSPRLLCVHATQLIDEEIELLAKNGSHVVHCPESNLKLASGFCEVQRLSDGGVNVALGTDGAASNNDLDMFGELHTAAILAKTVAKDASALPAHAALEMATINGATAMGLENKLGSLEVGKFADITAVNLDQLNTQPNNNALSHIVYAVNSNQVSYVWCSGKPLLENGELKTIDTNAISVIADKWCKKFKDV